MKAAEFYALTQGQMSVDEYETRFSSLIRFAREVEAEEDLKTDRFCDGLRANIRTYTVGVNGYLEVVRRAQEGERDAAMRSKEWEMKNRSKNASQQNSSKNPGES